MQITYGCTVDNFGLSTTSAGICISAEGERRNEVMIS